MSTIKSDSIQPTLGTNNLILRTGSADVERVRISPSGAMTVSSTVSSTFSGPFTVAGAANINGRVAIGSAVSGTPNVDLEVISSSNSGLLDPQFNTFITTQNRANASIRASAGNTTLFFGNSGISAAWLQVQNSDNTQRSLALNPVGGNVGIGTTGPTVALDVNGAIKASTSLTVGSATMTAPSGTAPIFSARAWVSFDGTKDTTGATSTANTNRFINGQGNVSSVERLSSGYYKVVFSTPMPNNNYAVVPGGWNHASGYGSWITIATASSASTTPSVALYNEVKTVNFVLIESNSNAGARRDEAGISLIFFA